jgi:indole-3-glycerol phosphate synthase
MDFLDEIVGRKRERVEAAKDFVSFELMFAKAAKAPVRATPHALLSALLGGEGINVIGEFKRRSPSKGVIRSDADPVGIAKSYKAGGAKAISVLTEEDYFDGSLQDLITV